MSSEWPQVLIGDLADPRPGSLAVGPFGSRMKADLYVPAGVRVIRGNNLGEGLQLKGDFVHVTNGTADSLASCCLTPGDLVFPHRGNIGEVGITPDDGHRYMLSTSLMKLSPNRSKVDSLYLLYFFKSVTGRAALLMNASQVGTPGIATPLKSLRGIALALPPLEIQRAITAVLQALDDRITLLRETNATLEAIAQALFKSWFVDFDPVRAKMEGRTPEGMDEATAALFPDGFETSELGEVPRGWRVGQVADLGDVVCGKTPPTSAPENYGGDVPFITIPDMHDLLAVTTTARSLSKLGADSQPKKYLPPGAICVSCIATPGLVVRVTTTAQTNQQINSVIPHRKWGSSFPLFLLRRIGDAVRSGGSGGSVFHNLSKSGFEQLPVLLTEPELADRFNAVIDPLVEKIVANQLQTQTLSTLRDTLLPRLISGQLRLPEAQAATEAALGGTLSV